MRRLIYAINLATALSLGCTYIPEQKFKFPSMSIEQKTTEPISFNQGLEKHKYVLVKSNTAQPEIIFIGDVHSKPLRQRHCDFLNDTMQNKDALLLEGYAGKYKYEDLHHEVFTKGEMPKNLQTIIYKNADNIPTYKDAKKESYYQQLPKNIYGLEEAVLKAFQNDAFFSMIKTANNAELYDLYTKRFFIGLYNRNIAIARTIVNHRTEIPNNAKIYVIIGVQHLLTDEELKQQGVALETETLKILAGHLTNLLEKTSLPYAIIIPENIKEEKKRVEDDPTLRLDYEIRKKIQENQ